MKTILALVFLLGAFLPTGLARDEKAAVDELRRETTAIKAWMEEQEFKSNHPAARFLVMPEIAMRMKAIPTDGLPKDLAGPWKATVAYLERMAAVVERLPRDLKGLEKKLAEPGVAEQVTREMEAIEKEAGPEVAKLRAAAKKYGIDAMVIP
jgi:hypothetical protein